MPTNARFASFGPKEDLKEKWRSGKPTSLVVGRTEISPDGQMDNGIPDQMDRIKKLAHLPGAVALQTSPVLNSALGREISYLFNLPADTSALVQSLFLLASFNCGHIEVTAIRHKKDISPNAMDLSRWTDRQRT